MTNLAFRPPRLHLPAADREAAFDLIRTKSFKMGALFRLSSGQESSIYFNMKRSMLDPTGAYQFPLLLLHKLRELKCNAIGGLEMGAVPVISSSATLAALYEQEVRAFFIRKEAKSHGTRERIEGTDVDALTSASVAVVDDVTTTGGSALAAIDVLREFGVEVRQAITIVDREEGAAENLLRAGVMLHPLFRKSEFTAET